VTDYLHYPSGANLMWNTSILFPALVLTPVTNLFGPIVSYNLLTVLGMSLSGWCAFLAVRRFSRRWISAWVGGLLYEFSPFMAVQITGHAQLFVAVFPPLLVIFGDEILVRQRRQPWLIGGCWASPGPPSSSRAASCWRSPQSWLSRLSLPSP